VVLFVYARTHKLIQTLEGLRQNQIPLLIVFSDGPKGAADEPRVAEVRRIIDGIDWCKVVRHYRTDNLGLGRSIRRGVSEVLREYGRTIVFEDDIDSAPSMYRYVCAALDAYANDPRVMSISCYSHPRLRPPAVAGEPYFGGRFTCWGWATWERSWKGMRIPAALLMIACRLRGRKVNRYGTDLVPVAWRELRINVWAVRFALLHFLRGGVSLYPPGTLTNHMGFADSTTSEGAQGDKWDLGKLGDGPPPPAHWPQPYEEASLSLRFQSLYGAPQALPVLLRKMLLAWKWRAEVWWRKRMSRG
jgi:hypothetical protein